MPLHRITDATIRQAADKMSAMPLAVILSAASRIVASVILLRVGVPVVPAHLRSERELCRRRRFSISAAQRRVGVHEPGA